MSSVSEGLRAQFADPPWPRESFNYVFLGFDCNLDSLLNSFCLTKIHLCGPLGGWCRHEATLQASLYLRACALATHLHTALSLNSLSRVSYTRGRGIGTSFKFQSWHFSPPTNNGLQCELSSPAFDGGVVVPAASRIFRYKKAHDTLWPLDNVHGPKGPGLGHESTTQKPVDGVGRGMRV